MKKYIYLLLYIVGLYSCSAAKKVQKENADINALKQTFDNQRDSISFQAVEDYLKANPCGDATEVYNLDSFCQANYSCPGATVYKTDTLPGIRSKSGLKVVIKPVVDNRLVKLLSDSLVGCQLTIANLRGQVDGAAGSCSIQLTAKGKTIDFWRLIAICLAGFIVLVTFIKLYFKIAWL